MQISDGIYKNQKAVFMENETIKLCVLPKIGCKIASIIYKPQNFEVLFQPTEGKYKIPKYAADFSLYDTSGADEMFPSIDLCKYPYDEYKGVNIPDHGELWSIPWNVKKVDEKLICCTNGVKFKYIFRKDISIKANIIHIDYSIKNTGALLHFLWAFHGLAACDEDTNIIINGLDKVINVHKSKVLGEIGKIHSFPITRDIYNKEYNISKIQNITVNKTEKFYLYGELKKTEAALTLNHNNLLYKLSFPRDKVPYAGVWINEGGFKGEYNVALEPSTGFYDSLQIANDNNKDSIIDVNEEYSFYMNIELDEIN